MSKEDRFKHPEAVLAYLRRIGAEVLNFRRAMVKEHRGAYYVERTLIKINEDGSIDCSRPEHRPSKEEADAIKEALKTCEFPKSIDATESACKAYIAARGGDPKMFQWIRKRSTGKIAMMQERINKDDGTKRFISHSLWSDNQWRELEPDTNKLPFWKPRERREGAARIMVHEGAKAASHIDWLINDRSPEAKKAREAHPWAEDLASYEHWGMIGGAMAPHRSDYGEIRSEQPIEVVYVCDNDWPGKDALAKFSKNFQGSLKGIEFNKEWPESWDMADPIPTKMFRGDRYNGPNLKSLITPATWATELIPNPAGTGRPITVLRDKFAQEWMHSITPEAFIHYDWPSDILNADEFNSRVKPFSDVDNTARLLLANSASKSRRLHYLPGKPSGFLGNNQIGAFINTYCPSPIKPMAGDPEPWLNYMRQLIVEEEDRDNVLRWCATLIARPGIKMNYGMLLISETQGVGKTTLGEKILAPLVGFQNTSFPSESDIVESQFNSWIAHKRLAIVNEIYAGASAKAYNKLKSIIADEQITVNKKHQATYELESWIHVLACSNSTRALKLSMDDRRWLVPKVTEEKPTHDYWTTFNQWLSEEGGLQIIMQWAIDWALDNRPVLKGENAPTSSTKRAMIDDNLSPGQALVANLLDELAMLTSEKDEDKQYENRRFLFTTDQRLVDYIKTNLYGGRDTPTLERPATIRKLAKDRGWFVGEVKTRNWCPPGTIGQIVSLNKNLARQDPSVLAEILSKANKKDFDLSELEAMRKEREAL